MDEDRVAIDVREMLRSPGWKVIAEEIEDMIRGDEERLSSMTVEGRSPSDIGGEYIEHRRHADGLTDVLRLVRSYDK